MSLPLRPKSPGVVNIVIPVVNIIRLCSITNTINFDVSIYGKKATATLKVDRAKYNVIYGSTSFFDNLKDKAIYDEFDLIVDLEF